MSRKKVPPKAEKCNPSSRIMQIRTEKFSSRSACARACGVGDSSLRQWEEGSMPAADSLLTFCEVTGSRMQWILKGEEPKYVADLPTELPKRNLAIPDELRHVAATLTKRADELEDIDTGPFSENARPVIRIARDDDDEADPNFTTVPLMDGAAAAGYGGEVIEDWDGKFEIVPRGSVKYPQHTACIRVKGDSMKGVIHDKSIVGICWHPNVMTPASLNDAIVAAYIENEGMTVKRLKINKAKQWLLEPSNPDYDTVVIDPEREHNDARVVGRVVFGFTNF